MTIVNYISPFAPKKIAKMPESLGKLSSATASANIKYQNRDDLTLFLLPENAHIAGAFTKSATAAASVSWCQSLLEKTDAIPRAIFICAGNANAFTGTQGADNNYEIANNIANSLGFKAEQIYISSTGVIGEQLPMEKIIARLPQLCADASDKQSTQITNSISWESAAKAIATTDTYPKLTSERFEIAGKTYHIAGIAKGSGMIAPNMATMLAYLFTDAPIGQVALQQSLNHAIEHSFNSITVDSDTSTSDMVLLASCPDDNHHTIIEDYADPRLDNFKFTLNQVALDLALQIIKDGEGISKLITINIIGATDNAQAKKIGLAIGNSPLVKTAIAGADANWGRIIMAIGKTNDDNIDQNKLKLFIGKTLIAENGGVATNYQEGALDEYMQGNQIEILVDIGLGTGFATIYSSDLTHEYIKINADYRS